MRPPTFLFNPYTKVFILPQVGQPWENIFPQSPKWYLHWPGWEAQPWQSKHQQAEL